MEGNQKFGRRVWMSVFGVIICGISVGLFKHAALGVDPFQSLMSGLDALIPIHFGTLYVIVNLILLIFTLVLDRRKIGLATLINLFLLGYIAEFSQATLARLMPDPAFAGRLILLGLGVLIMCLSSALYFTADLGVSTYDALALIWSQRQKRVPFSICRVITDLACVTCGAALCRLSGFSLREIAGEVGIGTIVTAFFMGPLIQYFNRRVAMPLLEGKTHTVSSEKG